MEFLDPASDAGQLSGNWLERLLAVTARLGSGPERAVASSRTTAPSGPGPKRARQTNGSGWALEARRPAQLGERVQQDGADDHRASDDRQGVGLLAVDQPHPERAEHDLDQRDQAGLRGGDEAGAGREEDQPERDLTGAERGEQEDVARPARRAMCENGAVAANAIAMPSAVAGVIEISRWLRVITITTAKPTDITTHSASPQRPPDPTEPPTMMATPSERGGHRDPGAQGDRLAHQEPRQQRRHERRAGLEQQHVGDRRVRRARG